MLAGMGGWDGCGQMSAEGDPWKPQDMWVGGCTLMSFGSSKNEPEGDWVCLRNNKIGKATGSLPGLPSEETYFLRKGCPPELRAETQ